MNAAAHLLRRRSSLLSHQRHRILSILSPSLYRNHASSSEYRNFSANTTSKPQEDSTSRGVKLIAGATAVLVLSSAAWYTTRNEYSQVQHFGLPQLFHWRWKEENASVATDDKSPHPAETNQSGEQVSKGDAVRENQLFHSVIERDVPTHFADNNDFDLSEKASPQPPAPEQMSVVVVHESARQEPAEDIPSSFKETKEEPPPVSKETNHEKQQASEEAEQGSQIGVEPVVHIVEEKVYSSKDFDLDELQIVSEDRDTGEICRTDTDEIREKLMQENPEMFYLDSGSDERDDELHRKDAKLEEEHPSLEILEKGSLEYAGPDRVPSKLSASYLVHKGHEDSVRRYPDQKTDITDVLETAERTREDDTNVEIEKNVIGIDVLVGAIHTAEQLQAEIDSRTFQEQLSKLQEAHKHELNDFQAKIFAYAEDTDQLQKELLKEKEEAVTALKLQQEVAEEKLRIELQLQEEEAAIEKEKIRLLGQAQTAASVTREKADHLNDIHSVQLQMDALRTAFYTRSEEARISHTAHKLAMGAFALEAAIERGGPVENEAVLLIASAGGPGADPLVDAVVSSLPSEVLTAGARTRAQLYQKFTRLKGSLRELALMPSGGGVFAHLFARITANLKISEQGSDYVGSEGIEVVIGKVEKFLAEEKLVEAAVLLETRAKGTAAEDLAVEWAVQVRNRAIIEQGLQVLRAHVIAVASGLAS